jgi:predicted amidohydrolase
LRYYEYSQGVQVHIAGWPPMFDPQSKPGWFNQTNVGNTVPCQNMAIEGVCFVVVTTQVVTEKNYELLKLKGVPEMFDPIPGTKGNTPGGGGFAMIFGPDGQPLAEPLEKNEEGILTAVIDLKAIDGVKQVSLRFMMPWRECVD